MYTSNLFDTFDLNCYNTHMKDNRYLLLWLVGVVILLMAVNLAI